jgi:hypothetical protein
MSSAPLIRPCCTIEFGAIWQYLGTRGRDAHASLKLQNSAEAGTVRIDKAVFRSTTIWACFQLPFDRSGGKREPLLPNENALKVVELCSVAMAELCLNALRATIAPISRAIEAIGDLAACIVARRATSSWSRPYPPER